VLGAAPGKPSGFARRQKDKAAQAARVATPLADTVGANPSALKSIAYGALTVSALAGPKARAKTKNVFLNIPAAAYVES
jgi:hypothetical protein